MTLSCSIPSCPTKYSKVISLFKYPVKNRELFKKWKIHLLSIFPGFDFPNLKKARICQLHFEDKYIVRSGTGMRQYLTFDAIPTIFKNKMVTQSTVKNQSSSSSGHRQKADLKVQPKKLAQRPLHHRHKCQLCLKRLNSPESKVLEDQIRRSIEKTMNVHLMDFNGYSKFICNPCFQTVEKFEKFRTKILKSQESLLRTFKSNNRHSIKVQPIEVLSDVVEEKEVSEMFSDPVPENFPESCRILRYPVQKDNEICDKNVLESIDEQDVEFDNCILKIEAEEPKIVEQIMIQDISNHTTGAGVFLPKVKIEDDAEKPRAVNERRVKLLRQMDSKSKYQLYYRKIPCKFCGKEIAKLRMKSHIASFHDRSNCNFECDICGKRFFLKKRVEKHVETHMTCARFDCRFCGVLFKTSNLRSIHMTKVHTNPVKSDCKICGKNFYNQNNLAKHIFTHGDHKSSGSVKKGKNRIR